MNTTERRVRDFFADNHDSMRRILVWTVGKTLPVQIDRRQAKARGLVTFETELEACRAMLKSERSVLKDRIAVLKRRGT